MNIKLLNSGKTMVQLIPKSIEVELYDGNTFLKTITFSDPLITMLIHGKLNK